MVRGEEYGRKQNRTVTIVVRLMAEHLITIGLRLEAEHLIIIPVNQTLFTAQLNSLRLVRPVRNLPFQDMFGVTFCILELILSQKPTEASVQEPGKISMVLDAQQTPFLHMSLIPTLMFAFGMPDQFAIKPSLSLTTYWNMTLT